MAPKTRANEQARSGESQLCSVFLPSSKKQKSYGDLKISMCFRPLPSPSPRRHLACMHRHIHHFLGVVSVFGGTSRQGKSIFFSSVKKCCRELFECFRLLFRASRLLSSFSCFMKMREIFNTTELKLYEVERQAL